MIRAIPGAPRTVVLGLLAASVGTGDYPRVGLVLSMLATDPSAGNAKRPARSGPHGAR
jgi:hypothetical protein